jgi:2-oxoglutarate dehydrogenase E2 component (dihydrolipoamide succinyltransferase)
MKQPQSIEIKVPAFPESVTEGTIVRWNKKPGEPVKRDESLVDIETDKVVFEVPAPADGILQSITEDENAVVVSGQLIGKMEETELATTTVVQTVKETVTAQTEQDDIIVTPSARKLIDERSLDPHAISATGPGNRLLKEDVLRFLEAAPVTKETTAIAPEPDTQTPVPGIETNTGSRPERRVPMTRLRARIAERLVEAQHNAAILSTFNEINMQPVMALRKKHGQAFQDKYGIKLGFMSFFVKAVIEGLKRSPEINASIDGDDIVYHGYFDIGIAVASPRGLVVPILRDADLLSMADIEAQIAAYGQKATDGTLTMEDIQGGTFTISNGGVFGSMLSTPILNPPQSAILGMHKIQERPVAENGEVVIRPMMYVALSYDHRLIDGREAVRFLVTVKETLEDPARLLLQI